MLKSFIILSVYGVRDMKCPECGSLKVKKEDDGRNILIFCDKCGLVIEDEIVVC